MVLQKTNLIERKKRFIERTGCDSRNRFKLLSTPNYNEVMVIHAVALTDRIIAAMDVTISCDFRAFENIFSTAASAIAVTDP